jgi:hypothetical protein
MTPQEQIDILRGACMFVKNWLLVLEEFHADLHKAIDHALEVTAPCEHQWDGPRIQYGSTASVASCSRCGVPFIDLDARQFQGGAKTQDVPNERPIGPERTTGEDQS